MYQPRYQNESRMSEQQLIEPAEIPEAQPTKFTLMIDLSTEQAQALLDHCRKVQRPLSEVGSEAIAYYLSHTATELEKVLSLD